MEESVPDTPSVYASVRRIGYVLFCDYVCNSESDVENCTGEVIEGDRDEHPRRCTIRAAPRIRSSDEDCAVVRVRGVDVAEAARFLHVSIYSTIPGSRLRDSLVQARGYSSLGLLDPAFIKFMEGEAAHASDDGRRLDYILCSASDYLMDVDVAAMMSALYDFVSKNML